MKNSCQRSWYDIAVSWPVVRRAVIMASIVGFVLAAINHGSCFISGGFANSCAIQTGLTFCVPYLVSTISSVQAILCLQRRNAACEADRNPYESAEKHS